MSGEVRGDRLIIRSKAVFPNFDFAKSLFYLSSSERITHIETNMRRQIVRTLKEIRQAQMSGLKKSSKSDENSTLLLTFEDPIFM